MLTNAELRLPLGYSRRPVPNDYFVDLPSSIAEGIWQPDVYAFAAALSRRLGVRRLVDLGCGSGEKLAALSDTFETIGSLQWAKAEAVSADGMIMAGTGGLTRGNRAFVTTVVDSSTDPITLESTILPMLGGGKYAEAYAMTPDGTVIAGRSDSPKGPQACIWFIDETTGAWVVKGLGSLSQKNVDSMATGVTYRPNSAVGDLIVVGYSRTNLYASEAFVWTGNAVLEEEEDEIGYFYDLEYILTKLGVGEASGMGSDWVLNQATGISAAGDRIVGWGVNPEGGIEAWIVTGYPYDELVFTHE